MPVYSHSSLSTYEICPLKYKLKYIDKLDVEAGEGIETFLGSRVHEALERFYKDLQYSRLLTIEELINIFNEQWDKNWNDSIIIRKKDLSAINYRDTGIKCLKNYYSHYAPFNRATAVWIEKMLSFPLSDDGRYNIRGVIDRLDRTREGVYEIHDYKTSGSLPLQEHLNEDRQLALYEIGIREKFSDIKEVRLVWHYLVFDIEMSSIRTPGQLSDLRKDTIALIDKIESDREFKCKESELCEWCDYQEYCPVRSHINKVDSLPLNKYLEDDGVRLVNKYTSAWKKLKESEAEKDLLREALIAYAKKEGIEVIKGSGHTVKVIFKKGFKFPGKHDTGREDLEKIIIDAGLWSEISELDTNSLAKIVETGMLDEKLLKKIKPFAAFEERIIVNKPKPVREEE